MKPIFLAIVLTLFLVPCFAQTQTEKSPLFLNISFLKTTKSEQGFVVKAKLQNTSNDNVVIDKNALYYGLAFGVKYGSFLSQGEAGTGYEGNYLILAPGQTYSEYQTVKLPSNDFFNRDTEYKVTRIYGQFQDKSFQGLKVWHGSVESNELTFRLIKGRVLLQKNQQR